MTGKVGNIRDMYFKNYEDVTTKPIKVRDLEYGHTIEFAGTRMVLHERVNDMQKFICYSDNIDNRIRLCIDFSGSSPDATVNVYAKTPRVVKFDDLENGRFCMTRVMNGSGDLLMGSLILKVNENLSVLVDDNKTISNSLVRSMSYAELVFPVYLDCGC
ncbi:MAG: hypothetical protein ACR2MS_07830 [Weeksellaceae bacterium]